MNTFKSCMIQRMIDRGMHDLMAEEAFNDAIKDPALDLMRGRWNDHVDGYPEAMVGVTWLSIMPVLAKWLAKRVPQAWFRPMFEQGADNTTDPDKFVRDFWEKNPQLKDVSNG